MNVVSLSLSLPFSGAPYACKGLRASGGGVLRYLFYVKELRTSSHSANGGVASDASSDGSTHRVVDVGGGHGATSAEGGGGGVDDRGRHDSQKVAVCVTQPEGLT